MLISNDISSILGSNNAIKPVKQAYNDIITNITAKNRVDVKPTIVKDDMPDALDMVIDDCKAFNENRIWTINNDDSIVINRHDKFLSKFDTRFRRFAVDFIKRFNESNFTNLVYTIVHERQIIVITNLTYRQANERN